MGQLAYTTAEIDTLLMKVDKMGWEVSFDGTYTSGSPFAIPASTRTLMPCDGLGSNSNNTYLPSDVTELWDTTLDKIVSDNVGNAFEVRVQFIADPGAISASFDMEFDIGNGAPNIVIAARTINAPKGADPFVVSVAIPIYSLGTFVTNGCKIYINTTDSGDTFDIYDISVLIKQDYHA
jgi:hypothetical protein